MIFCTLLFLFNSSFGLPEIKLRSLSDASTTKIELNSTKPKIFVVFQKDCHACRKQVKELECLSEQADTFLVGSFSSEKDLRKEYRTFNSNLKGVYGDQAFKRMFNINEKITPQIIFSKGSKYKFNLGRLACNEILKKLNGKF